MGLAPLERSSLAANLGDGLYYGQIETAYPRTPIHEEFHDQLGVWGHHAELKQLYGRVVHQLSPQFNAIVLNSLGRLWTTLGNYEKAIAYHEQSLELDRKLEQTAGVGASLANLGAAYGELGDYRQWHLLNGPTTEPLEIGLSTINPVRVQHN